MKTIVLTGATRGIGRALVQPLTDLGHTVVGCGRSTAKIDDLGSAFDPPHRFDTVDVSVWEEVEARAHDVLEFTPPPDLLINNAGIINRNAPLWQVGDEEFRQVLAVNVAGPD